MPVAEAHNEAANDMVRINADVRLDVALKRIAILEREVAELKANPATVDADLLRQQLSVTQNALADASRDTAQDVPALPPPADNAAPRAPPKSSGGSVASKSLPQSRAGAKPASRPKPQATDRPGLDLDLR